MTAVGTTTPPQTRPPAATGSHPRLCGDRPAHLHELDEATDVGQALHDRWALPVQEGIEQEPAYCKRQPQHDTACQQELPERHLLQGIHHRGWELHGVCRGVHSQVPLRQKTPTT